MPNKPVKVIIVEDNRFLRETLVDGLKTAGHHPVGVAGGLEFYRALAEDSFAVAVVDLMLPDHCGYALAEFVRSKTTMGVIILTGCGEVNDRVRGYESGADLYLVKPVDVRELASAISSLALRIADRQQEPLPPSGNGSSWQLLKREWCLVTPSGTSIQLTPKEMQFMQRLCAVPESPVRRETLLETLGYGDDEYASRALDALVRRLRRKIEEDLRLPSPIKTVHRIGYCFSDQLNLV